MTHKIPQKKASSKVRGCLSICLSFSRLLRNGQPERAEIWREDFTMCGHSFSLKKSVHPAVKSKKAVLTVVVT